MTQIDKDHKNQSTDSNHLPIANPWNIQGTKGINKSCPSNHITNTGQHHEQTTSSIFDKNDQPFIANVISFAMFLVTIILARYSFRLFKQAFKQTEVAASSAYSAKMSADAAKTSADIQSEVLKAQIASLNETQRQFDIINRPYLQFTGFVFTDLTEGMPIKYAFDLSNYGIAPVKIISKKVHAAMLSENIVSNLNNGIEATIKSPILSYVSKEGITIIGQTTWNYNAESRNHYGNNLFFYLIGEIEYTNLITNKEEVYNFKVQIMQLDTGVLNPYLLFE